MFSYKVKIRESHLDTLGHVNNAVYLVLFEEARWAYFLTEHNFQWEKRAGHFRHAVEIFEGIKTTR